MTNSKFSQGVVHKLPADLKNALITIDAINIWNNLTPLGRNEFICWIEDAKKQETREKRIERTATEIIEGKRRPCCWPGCAHRNKK